MRHFIMDINGIDGSTASFRGYVSDNSDEIVPDRRRPAVLIIPGGGYEMTSDREAEPIAMRMLGLGFQAFVLRYSAAPSRYPVALLEAAQAMRLIRLHADEWHVDPQSIVAMGFSAGGHLAASLGTESGDEALREHGYDPDDTRPDGLALCYPVISSGAFAHRGSFEALLGERADDPAALESVSLERRVTPSTPPTFIWHTVPDDCVPVQNTLLFVDALMRNGVPVEAHLFPSGGHGLSLGTAESAWQGVNGIVECVQIWPRLFDRWMRGTFASYVG